jgi:hypothetical protein
MPIALAIRKRYAYVTDENTVDLFWDSEKKVF